MSLFGRLFGRGDRVPEWARFLAPGEFRALVRLIRADLDRRALAYDFDASEGIVRLPGAEGNDRVLGLLNLMQVCHGRSASEWPGIVAGHFGRVLTHGAEAIGEIDRLSADFEEARGLIKVRLYPAEVAAHEAYRSAVTTSPMPDVLATLVYDMPETIITVHREHAESWGVPPDDLFAIALANVRDGDPVKAEPLDLDDGTPLTVLSGESFFTASHALLLRQYLSPEHDLGALVAVPHRHAVVFHPIVDAKVIPAINALIALAHGMYRDGPGSVSPHLYWWRLGEFTQLPATVVANSIEFSPPEEFVHVLNRVVSRPEPS
jgi:hypothetical protein